MVIRQLFCRRIATRPFRLKLKWNPRHTECTDRLTSKSIDELVYEATVNRFDWHILTGTAREMYRVRVFPFSYIVS